MISTLSLRIDNKGDCTNFRITDDSYYNPKLPITCGRLVIIPPNKNKVEFEVEPYFSTTFNAANLKIQNEPYECLDSLPEGIYFINYSINPNDRIFVNYYYLHNCAQYQKFINLVCSTFSNRCNFTKKEFNEKLEELMQIKKIIDSSKYLVEYCNNPEEGMDLYKEADLLLSKYKVDVICTNCK